MEEISVNELSRYTPWVARLAGVEPFSKPTRNIQKIDAEYDKDKYAELLKYFKHNPDAEPRQVKIYESRNGADTEVCISMGGKLLLTSHIEAQCLEEETLVNFIGDVIGQAPVVVELGCGYGYNLFTLSKA